MLRLLVLVVLAFLAARAVGQLARGLTRLPREQEPPVPREVRSSLLVRCPACGLHVTAERGVVRQDVTYCSDRCAAGAV